MADDEQLPGLDDLSEIERHDVIELVNDGRAVDDRRLARAAVEFARRNRRGALVIAGTMVVAVPLLAFALAPLIVDGGVVWWVPVVIGVAVAPFALGFGWISYADAAAAERANRALLDGEDHQLGGGPTRGQRIGTALLALLVASFTARILLAVMWALLRTVGVDLTELDAAWQTVISVAVAGPVWLLGYRALVDRYRPG